MTDVHVNYDNIRALLIGIKQNLNQSINNIDLTEEQKNLINKADKLKIDGDGNSYLSDNGTYKPINLEELESIYTKITAVYNLFNITENKEFRWGTSTLKSVPIYDFSCESFENKIYCICGEPELYSSKGIVDVAVLDTISNTWANVSPSPIKNYGTRSIIYKGQIYYIGILSPTIYKYDINTDTWSSISDLPNNRGQLTIEFKNNKIYFIAGGSIRTTNVYDIETGIWSTVSDCPTTRIRLSSCVYNNKIYCIGGYGNDESINKVDYLNTLEIYDIENDTWTTGPAMPNRRGLLSCEIYNDKIYCIGGYGENTNKQLQIYDINNNKWILGVDEPYRHSHCSSIINNKIYIISGSRNETDTLELPYISYDIKLPEELQSKADIIKNDGDGNKLLADNGTYIEYIPSGYRELNVDELNALIEEIKTV